MMIHPCIPILTLKSYFYVFGFDNIQHVSLCQSAPPQAYSSLSNPQTTVNEIRTLKDNVL